MFLSLIVFQVAVIDLLADLEIEFYGFIGYSFGEIAALYACGTLTQYQAIKVAEFWSDTVELTQKGAMMAVIARTADEMRNDMKASVFERYGVELACVNSSVCVVVSGRMDDILRCKMEMECLEHKCILLNTSCKAFHSSLMYSCVERYRTLLKSVLPRETNPPSIFVSSSQPNIRSIFISPSYFTVNLRKQGKFHESLVKHLPADDIVVEI